MSTNFYWIQRETSRIGDNSAIHIGKLYSRGGGRMGFTWAQLPHVVRAACAQMGHHAAVVDETDREYTGHDFLRAIADARDDLELVGERFS